MGRLVHQVLRITFMAVWIRGLLLLGSFGACVTSHASGDLQSLVSDYESCATSVDVRDCRRRKYEPILEYCRDRIDGCVPQATSGRFDTWSTYRCMRPSSCTVSSGASGDLMRLAIRPGEERAEIRDPYEGPYGTEVHYRMRLRIPAWSQLRTDTDSMVLVQFKATNALSPPVALRLKEDGTLAITVRHDQGGLMPDSDGIENGREVAVTRVPFSKGEAHDLTFSIRSGKDGYLRVYDNGKLIADYKGPLGYEGTANYLKIGPYDYSETQKYPFEAHYADFWRGSQLQDQIAVSPPAEPALGVPEGG